MSGGGSGGTTVQEKVVPDELLPFIRAQHEIGLGALRRQEGLLRGAGAAQLVAPFNPLQQQGFASAQQAVGAGGIIPEVTGQLQGTARGDFLFGNAGFDEAVQASIRAAQPHILSTFGRAGGTPGGLAEVALQQAASDSFASLFGQERARQQQAQLALPQLSLIPSDVLSGIGGEQQALAQRQLLAPISANEMLAALAGGTPLSAFFGSSSTSNAPSRNRALGAVIGGAGGALTGAGTGAAIGAAGGPIGAGGGALIGGLLGAFGGGFG